MQPDIEPVAGPNAPSDGPTINLQRDSSLGVYKLCNYITVAFIWIAIVTVHLLILYNDGIDDLRFSSQYCQLRGIPEHNNECRVQLSKPRASGWPGNVIVNSIQPMFSKTAILDDGNNYLPVGKWASKIVSDVTKADKDSSRELTSLKTRLETYEENFIKFKEQLHCSNLQDDDFEHMKSILYNRHNMTKLSKAITYWTDKEDKKNSICECASNVRSNYVVDTANLKSLYSTYASGAGNHSVVSEKVFVRTLARNAPTSYMITVATDQTSENLKNITQNDFDIIQACYIYSIPTYMEKYEATLNAFNILIFGMYFLAFSATVYAVVDTGPLMSIDNTGQVDGVQVHDNTSKFKLIPHIILLLLNLALVILVFVYVLTPSAPARNSTNLDENDISSLAYRDASRYTLMSGHFWQYTLAIIISVQFIVEGAALLYNTMFPSTDVLDDKTLINEQFKAFLRVVRCDLPFIIASCMIILSVSLMRGKHNLHSLTFDFISILCIAFLQHISHVCRVAMNWVKILQIQNMGKFMQIIRDARIYIFFAIIFILYAFVYQSVITKLEPSFAEVFAHNIVTWAWVLFLTVTVLPDILCEIHPAWLRQDKVYDMMKIFFIFAWIAYILFIQIKINTLSLQVASSTDNFMMAN
jgi:hypothetical protein